MNKKSCKRMDDERLSLYNSLYKDKSYSGWELLQGLNAECDENNRLEQEIGRLKNEMSARYPLSYGNMRWACGHEGPAACLACRDDIIQERNELREKC